MRRRRFLNVASPIVSRWAVTALVLVVSLCLAPALLAQQQEQPSAPNNPPAQDADVRQDAAPE
jgi:hypothetical protein